MDLAKKSIFSAGLFVLILLLGAGLRFYGLESVPPGLNNDEGFNATSALLSLQSGKYKLFYYQGKWALTGPFIWLNAATFALFGERLWSIRIIPAMAGVLSLMLMYGFCLEYWRESKRKYELSLLTCAFLAVSSWHLFTTRLFFHGTLVPPVEIAALWALLVALRRQTSWSFVLAGILTGIGIYTYWQYVSFMLLPFTMLAWHVLKKNCSRSHAIVFIASFLLVTSPFIAASLSQNIFNRINFLKVTNEVQGKTSLFDKTYELTRNIKNNAASTIAMLFFSGDKNWRQNYNNEPALGFVAQCGLLLSLIYARRQARPHPSVSNGLIWGWFVVAMIPAVLSNNAVPHSWRANCMILPCCMLAAYGFISLFDTVPPRYYRIVCGLMTVAMLFTAANTYHRYFNKWASHIRTRQAFEMNYVKYRYEGRGPVYKTLPHIQQGIKLNARQQNEP